VKTIQVVISVKVVKAVAGVAVAIAEPKAGENRKALVVAEIGKTIQRLDKNLVSNIREIER
jgi:hypothetical protein